MRLKILFFLFPLFLLFSCASTPAVETEFVVSEKPEFICRYRLPKDYSKAESYRTGAPHWKIVLFVDKNDNLRKSDIDLYVDSLCKLIRSEAKDDFEKAKMAHDFAAYLLPYDYQSLAGNRKWQDWRAVIRNMTGVCEGYARVFKEICTRVGLKCVYVSGFAGRMGSNSYHAWNIVQCEKEWYLVDPTWDTYVVPNTKKNITHTTYLFPRPEKFILTHYPTAYETDLGTQIGNSNAPDYHLQLLANPLSTGEHAKLLSLRSKEAIIYADYDSVFDDFYSTVRKDVYIGENMSFRYQLKPNKRIWVCIYKGKDKGLDKPYLSCNATASNNYRLPKLKPGTYTAIIYGGNINENVGYGLLRFYIHAGAPEEKWNVLPEGGIHIPVNFGKTPDYTLSPEQEEDESASMPNIALTGTVHELDLSAVTKKLQFEINKYSPASNPTIYAEVRIATILKMKNIKPGDIIRFKGTLETTDRLTNLSATFFDPNPAFNYWKDVASYKIIVASAAENSTVEFSEDFVVVSKPKTDFKIQFSLNRHENDDLTKTKVIVK